MIETVWVYLEPGMVQSGELPELARGSHLRGVGLRAYCLNITPARSAMEGLTELVGPGGEALGSRWYEMTGVAGEAKDVVDERGPVASEFVISTGDHVFIAWARGLMPGFAAGLRITAHCTLNVVGDYEWDAFELPDLRTDWYVRQLKIEQRQIGEPSAFMGGYHGKALRSYDIERMRRWQDNRDHGVKTLYLLDLTSL